MSAYQQMKTALEGILPQGWKLTPWEPLLDLPDVVSVTMKVRTISRLPAAPLGAYQVDWVLTITAPTTSREGTDPILFDQLIEFVGALDDTDNGLSWMGWTEATKTVGDDLERLAYDITVRTRTNKEGA